MMADDTDTPVLRPPTTDRRALFGAAALLGVAGVLSSPTTAASAAASGADAELLALCASWYPANDRYMAVSDRLDDILEDDQSPADRALMEEVHRAVNEIEERIFDTPASTFGGLKAKAEILAFMGDEMGIPVDSANGWSLVQDILALGGAA